MDTVATLVMEIMLCFLQHEHWSTWCLLTSFETRDRPILRQETGEMVSSSLNFQVFPDPRPQKQTSLNLVA